jgi:putative cell wall-binding protein
VLSRADSFADALAGTPLAVAKNAPLLLTPPTGLDPGVRAEIQRAVSPGHPVYLLGGNNALDPAIDSQLQADGYTVRRYAGTDRFDTAAIVADQGLNNPATVLEATGLGFADALAAGAAAAKAHAAVLLTADSTMPAATANYLANHPSVSRWAIGGPAAAADPGASGIVGSDRYDTSTRVAQTFFSSPTAAGVAYGANFPDALSGGAHIALRGGPLLLADTNTLPSPVHTYLNTNTTSLARAFVYGGTAVLTDTVRQAVLAAINGS